jgi:nucleotide-binding universal stress UspA family protein
MPLTTIVSYDGTSNDADALTLAHVLGEAGARLILAYVRHDADARDEDSAHQLLERGAAALADIHVETRVVVHASTSEGLKELARAEDAQLIVFGSDYRTPAGRVAPQQSTQKLLDGGPTAIAIAPADYQERPIRTIGLLAGLDDAAAIDTAHALANHFGATVTDTNYGVDLLIVGSRPEAHEGSTLLSAQAENAIVGTTAPVLVIARGVPVDFQSELYIA